MPEPITLTILSGLSGAATAALSCSTFVINLKNCSEDVKTCFDLVQRVWDDVHYALHLRTMYRGLLLKRPAEASRIDSVVQSAVKSVQDVGILIERVRTDETTKKFGLGNRLRWISGDSSSFVARTINLQAQHRAILTEITYLRNLDMMVPIVDALDTTVSFDNLDVLRVQNHADKNHYIPPSLPGMLGPYMQYSMSSETLVGSTFEEYVARSFHLVTGIYELDAGRADKLNDVKLGGLDARRLDGVTISSNDRSDNQNIKHSGICAEDLEFAFFRDWKSQEEESRERLGSLR